MQIQKKDFSAFEITGYVLIMMGLVILGWALYQFHLLDEQDTSPDDLNTRFGQFGEFIGGIVGSLWALAGVFLFFATLTYQKREFQLQRSELHKTQKIYQQQNFSTLFISFLSQHNTLLQNLVAFDINNSEWKGSNFFIFFKEKVMTSFTAKVRSLPVADRDAEHFNKLFKEYFTYHYSFHQNSLDPYLKNLHVLFSMIERYRSETADPGEYYSFITTANLSQTELFLIYHIAYFNIIPDFANFTKAFGIFDKLQDTDKVFNIIKLEMEHTTRSQL